MTNAESAPLLIRLAAAALAALGLSVFIGWSFGIDALKAVLPGANSMKVNTALGFLLAGIALWFAASERTDTIANVARRWAPILMAALGAAALFEYAAGVDLGINELLFRDDAQYGARGRMSVITAIAFILFAAAMLLPKDRTPRNNATFLALATIGFASGALATFGYMYQLPILYRPIPASSIAVHTAIGLTIAFAGVFATRADLGWLGLMRSQGVAGVFGRQLLPTVTLAPLLIGWFMIAVVRAGLLDAPTARALFILINVVVLAVVVTGAARALATIETTLRRREQIYASITTNALDAFLLSDGDGCILDWNPQAERMFGWRRDEVMGRVVREVIMPPETRAGHAQGLERFKMEGQYEFFGKRVEVDAVRRGDVRFRAELIAIPIQLGKDLYFALYARDVTGVREAEEQLRQAQKMEAVGQLTGGIAHDFNNTLTAIITTLDSALPRAPAELKPRIEIALNAADRAADMIKQLMAFSRKQVLTPTRLKLNDEVTRTAEMLRRTLGERIEIALELGPSVPDALADLSQLENALVNLCINARDAMPEGGKLTIETSPAELDAAYAAQNLDVKPGHYVMVAVSDTGAGMSPETLERVFEPFFTTKEVNRGTGLGLSMVHGFVKQSGGHVKLYSEVGHGTTVRLYLPLADATAKEANGNAHANAAPRGGDETILLVEDNALVRTSARSALRDLGYTILEAEDGRGALAIIRSGAHIDLLFTDIVMPGITGVELADEATRIRPSLRVLFTSGYPDKAVTDHARLEAGSRFLSKPYRTQELAIRIREALDEQKPQAQQRA